MARAYSAGAKMTDGEQEPESEVEMDGVEAAEKRYDEASPENREAAWLELWHARDFTWQGRSEKAMLQTEMVEVPASFPDGREAEGEFKTVSLQDYWRWSIGLPGEERLLTDEEMREAGLLVEVEGETYHLIHAPDMGLKADEHGKPLKILTDVVSARGKRVQEDIGTDANGRPNFARELQLSGGWLPGSLLRHTGAETAIDMSGARVSDIDLCNMKVGHLNCFRSLFTGKADFDFATFSGAARFYSATFSGKANFYSATFSGEADFNSAAFSGAAFFRDATFSGEAEFYSATFSGKANFYSATFSGEASFNNAAFSGEAVFRGATFSGEAFFMGATFKDSLTFEDGTFESVVSFNDVTWSKTNSPNAFLGVRFKDRVDFKSSYVPSISAFNEAHFEIPPSFRDLTQRELDEVFGDAISQTNASIRQVKKEKAEAKRKKEKYKGRTPDQLLAALEGGFRTLKKVADEKGNFLLSQSYYRFEVRTRVKRPEIAFWEKVAATFYGLSSDYGNSIARPFVSLAVILAGFAAIYLALAIEVNLVDWRDRSALQSGFFESLDFSLNNVFRPLSALSTDAPREGDASSLAGKLLNNYGRGFGLIVTAISIVQSLTSIVLAFLFGLAVRRRFQIS